MPWVRIDDHFSDHPKAIEAGPLAIAMQVVALCYANRNLTDGFISRAVAARLLNLDGLLVEYEYEGGGLNDDQRADGWRVKWQKVVERLVDAGMWEPVEGGWLIHDYHEYQPSRTSVLAERADPEEVSRKRREAGRLGGLAKARNRPSKSLANRQEDAKQLVSNDVANAQQNSSYPVPVPDPVPGAASSEELARSNARAREVSASPSAWHPKDFREAVASFCDEYPKPGEREATAAALAAACPAPEDYARVMVGLAAWKRSDKWLEQYPRFVPRAEKFLAERQYLHPPQLDEPAANGARPPALSLVERNTATIKRVLGKGG